MTEIKNIKNVTLMRPVAYNRPIRILTGQRFAMMAVFGYLGRFGKKCAHSWLCRCDCGEWVAVTGQNLLSGNSKNCGCLNNIRISNVNRSHGQANKSVEYQTWKHIRGRCNTTTNKRYADYGGRGITICERWESFDNFLTDMGKRPSTEHSIERINNDGNYEPGNCKWATKKEQNNNKRSNHRVTIDGRTLNIAQWCAELHISRTVIYLRIKQGMTPIEALTKPKQSRYYK